jgi:ABC-type Fe3+-hydroxamate transport system substrate-binding protein
MSKLPQRIISLVPSITETLYDLCLDQEVIGITHFCDEPPHWRTEKNKLGGTKLNDAAKIIELKPDLVILNREENLKQLAEQLDTASISSLVTFPRTVAEGIAMVKELAEVFAKEAVGEVIVEEIRAGAAQLKQRPFRYLCFIWKAPYMTISNDTFIHDMLSLIGGVNAAENFSKQQRYFNLDALQIAEVAADWVFFPDEPYPFKPADLEEFSRQFVDHQAVKNLHLLQVSGKALSWYGSGMRRGMKHLFELNQLLGKTHGI